MEKNIGPNGRIPSEIPKRSSRCSEGDEPLKQGEEYYSVLVQDDKTEQFSRKEFCLSCWDRSENQGSIYWKAKIPVQKKKDKQQEDQQLLVKLHEYAKSKTAEEKARALALSLYLVRKKKMIMRKEIKSTKEEVAFFEVIHSGETFKLKKVPLKQLQEALLWLSTLRTSQ